MKNKVYLAFIVIISVISACRKNPEALPLSPAKEITTFQLDANLNPDFLKETITGTIEDSVISLVIPQTVDVRNLVATFDYNGKSVKVDGVLQKSGETVNDFTQPLTYLVTAEDGSEKIYRINIEILPELKPGVPHLYINTENGAPVDSKENYVKASLRLDGAGVYENYEGNTSIKGRGNSTWFYPKKPYRLKLDTKAPLLGLSAEKDWILLANYLDGSLMLNAVALKMGRLLDMPYTNHIIPVDVTLNGVFLGNYMFTEQKEVEDNRINVGDSGVLLEMDVNYDENWKFMSKFYSLPVMIQYPDLDKSPKDEADRQFAKIKSEFETFEQLIGDVTFPNNNYLDYLDADALVTYFLIYDFTRNGEINHPKSTYLYKHKGGKYMMGPIWDFDWAYGYDGNGSYFNAPSLPLFETGSIKGAVFFRKFLQDPQIRSLYRQKWNKFKTEKLSQLLTYIDDYAKIIKDSYQKNYDIWKKGTGNLALDVQHLKTYLNARAAYIDTEVADM